jgi:serine/threonine protein kinase
MSLVGPFILERPIGSGGFATVYLGRHNWANVQVAVKSISKDSLSSDQARVRFGREVSIQRSLHHPFINELFDVIETDTHYHLILELVVGGSLLDRIKKARVLDEETARHYFVELLSAIEYLHEKGGAAHRDLKCENILIDRLDNIRIIDFGLSRKAEDEKFRTLCGSPDYAAPEILESCGYTQTVDIWDLGIILYAMVVGRLPFADTSIAMTLQKIRLQEPEYPGTLSPAILDLLQKLLRKDPAERIDIRGIKAHPWLAAISWNDVHHSIKHGNGKGLIEPAIVERMVMQGIDCSSLRESICEGEVTELTVLYNIFRKAKVADRMKHCVDGRTLLGGSTSWKPIIAPPSTSSLGDATEDGNPGLVVGRAGKLPGAQMQAARAVVSMPHGLRLPGTEIREGTAAYALRRGITKALDVP